MGKEFIRKDINGNDVYLRFKRSDYSKTLINCYAYRKVTKKSFFIKYTKYKAIHNFDSDLWDTRCNSYAITENFNEEILNLMLDEIMEEVNDSIVRKQKHKKALSLIFN
jgi:hypothetical protein